MTEEDLKTLVEMKAQYGKTKPKCFGCGKVGEEGLYVWHKKHLWHQSCYISIGMTIDQQDPSANEKNKELFLERMIKTNAVLQANIKAGNKKEIDRFIKNVLLPRGYTEQEIRGCLQKNPNLTPCQED